MAKNYSDVILSVKPIQSISRPKFKAENSANVLIYNADNFYRINYYDFKLYLWFHTTYNVELEV